MRGAKDTHNIRVAMLDGESHALLRRRTPSLEKKLDGTHAPQLYVDLEKVRRDRARRHPPPHTTHRLDACRGARVAMASIVCWRSFVHTSALGISSPHI